MIHEDIQLDDPIAVGPEADPVHRTAIYAGWEYKIVCYKHTTEVYDEEGDWVTNIVVADADGLADDVLSAFIHMYHAGREAGRSQGVWKAQRDMRNALGMN